MGQETRFVELAGEINRAMPERVIKRLKTALAAQKKSLRTARVAKAAYYDPHVPVIRPTREHPHWAGTKSVKWNRRTLAGFDAVLIATAHDAVDYKQLAAWASLIVDTRNVMARIPTPDQRVWKA